MRTLALLLLNMSFCLTSWASTDWEVSYQKSGNNSHNLSFEINHYELESFQTDQHHFTKINLSQSVNLEQKSWAELPYIHASLNIEEYDAYEVSIIGKEYTDIQLHYPILPSKGVIFRDEDPTQIPFTIAPQSIQDRWYPQELIQKSAPFYLRSQKGLNIYVYPFQYNAVTQTLRVYKKLDIQLNPKGLLKKSLVKQHKPLREEQMLFNSVFINAPNNFSREELSIQEYGDMLIVTTPRDEEAIKPYTQWKKQKGYQVKTIVVPAGTNVKETIQNEYDENNNLLYVQLVGDWADIKTDLSSHSSPMDPMLGCVVGDDYYIDLCVGRFSGENPDQISIQAQKAIDYEKTPEGDSYSKALSIASMEGAGLGDDNEVDYVHTDNIYNNKLSTFTYTEHLTVYEPNATSSLISEAINSGVGIINYTGHGSVNSWVTGSFSSSHVDNLTNTTLPFIISVACDNGDFHLNAPCFAEHWLRNEDAGAVCILAATISQPWQPPMRGQDYFNDLLSGGYDYDANNQSGISTNEQRTSFGALVNNALVLMLKESNSSSDIITVQTWTTFGDASLQIRTEESKELTLSNNIIQQGIPFSTIVFANGEPIANAWLVIDQNEQSFQAFSNEDGLITLEQNLSPGEAQITLTAFNGTPLFEQISVIPSEGAFIQFNSCLINDQDGDQDGMQDYFETNFLTIELKNSGTEMATAVQANLSSENPLVQILESSADYGDIGSGEYSVVDNGFKIKLDPTILEGEEVFFKIDAIQESGEIYASYFSLTIEAPKATFLSFEIIGTESTEYLQAGESGQLEVKVSNQGSSSIFNGIALLTPDSELIELNNAEMNFDVLAPGEELIQTINFFVSEDAPLGSSVNFTYQIQANYLFDFETNFNIQIGRIPVLIYVLSKDDHSKDPLIESLETLQVAYDIKDKYQAEDRLANYSSIWVLQGTSPYFVDLSNELDEALETYLEQGGNVYMEGADSWAYGPQSRSQSLFNIQGISDGGANITLINALNDSHLEGLSFKCILKPDHGYIDEINAISPAENWFSHSSPDFISTVANETNTYKTIGSSIELSILRSNDENTITDLVQKYLDFFTINSVSVPEQIINENSLKIYPNPSTSNTFISYNLTQDEEVSIQLFNIQGQHIQEIFKGHNNAGKNQIHLNTKSLQLKSGLYILQIQVGQDFMNKKWLIQP